MSSARLLKHTHLAMTLFWLLMVPVSILTGIWRRVEYVTFLSIWALVITHGGAWQASRAEVKVEATQEVKGQDITVHEAQKVERE